VAHANDGLIDEELTNHTAPTAAGTSVCSLSEARGVPIAGDVK
jgi:hypothetical protein